MKNFGFCFLLIFPAIMLSQDITPQMLLKKSSAYHDPLNQWPTFKGSFNVAMTTPDGSSRNSKIFIDLLSEYFRLDVEKDDTQSTYIIDKKSCQMLLNGEVVTKEVAAKSKMECDRGLMYKNYYTYLYGLPMKLNDPGTNIDYKVALKEFKNKSYLVLKATYDKSVGSDAWYFYFNPNSYAMEIYQFFKSDESGKEIPGSGEYILLSEEALVGGIKMPKIRAWYYNKDDNYLGTDTLID